jgi:DNA-directed RNA polymerase specialized sigma subunit
MDLAEKIAGNFARHTVHPKEDLLQLAMIGLVRCQSG